MFSLTKSFCVALTVLISSEGFSQTNEPDTAAKSMEAVVVTGQYAPQSLKSSVYKVRVINQERIKLRGATDIAGVLNNEIGIRFSNDFALGESDISIMGMSGQNVKVLIDGIPLIDRGSFKQSLSQIDINTVERIEIVEGPMSVVYGTDALAGVINIITKKGKAGVSSLSITARMQEETTADSYYPFIWDGIHNQHLGVNWSNGKWNSSAYITRNSFGGFSDTAIYPLQEWKPKDQWLGGGTIGYRNNRFNAWYRLDYLNEEIFAAGNINLNTYKALDQYFTTNRFTHQLQTDWQIADAMKLNTALSYQDYKRNTKSYTYDYRYSTETPSYGRGLWDTIPFKNFFFRSTLQWIASKKLSLQPGVEFKTDKTSGQRINGEPGITDYSLFASAEYKPVASVILRPGVRFSNNSVYDAPPVIPSLNTKIILSKDFDLRLSYARGFRAPVLRELYFLFKDAANHDIQGNTDLKAEYSNSYQASVAWQPSSAKSYKLSTTLSGFYNDFNDRIELALITGTTTYTYLNVEKYKTTGATLENNFSYKNLSATLGIAYIGRYNSVANDADFKSNDLPEFVWSPEVSTNILYSFSKIGLQLGLFYKFTGKLPSYRTDFNRATGKNEAFLAEVESYNWADFTLSKNLFKYFTLQGGIKNLFDITRLQNSVTNSGSIHNNSGPVLVGYGRSYFLGLNFQWNK
jgi:outer membrane receptor for ferrienterochelin and colicins